MSAPSRLRSALALLGFSAAALAAAVLAAHAAAAGAKDWYPALTKPAWTPPSRIFGPVWALLYVATAVVAWRVWRLPETGASGPTGRAGTLRRWWLQLALNAAWPWAFFWFRKPAAGLAIIGALFVVLASIQPRLARSDRSSALLWTPCVLWVGFAAWLNLWIWHHN